MTKIRKKPAPHNKRSRTPQKSSKYRPTVAEKKLLEVLLNPEHRFKSVTEICGLAKIDRKTYYNSYDKEAFCKYAESKIDKLIDKNYASIIHGSIHSAARGDAAHTKIMLQMKGKLVEKHVFPGKDGEPQQIAPSLDFTDTELATRVAFLLHVALERKKAKEAKDGK
jgi:hypothetical protein